MISKALLDKFYCLQGISMLPCCVLWHPGVMPVLVCCGVAMLVSLAVSAELLYVLGGVCVG